MKEGTSTTSFSFKDLAVIDYTTVEAGTKNAQRHRQLLVTVDGFCP
jgi:hypothetical protein